MSNVPTNYTISKGQSEFSRSWNAASPAPVLRVQPSPWSLHPPPPQEPPLLYVGTSLTLPHYEAPSGSFMLFEMKRDFLVVGGISPGVQTTSSWVTSTTPSPWALYHSGREIQGFQLSFRKYTLYPTPILQLIPGDVIISIGGRPVSNFGGKRNVEQFLSQSRTHCIVAVRHERVRIEVQSILHSARGPTSNLEEWISTAAYQQLFPFLHLLPSPVAFISQGQQYSLYPACTTVPTTTSLVRMVTPEKPVTPFQTEPESLKRKAPLPLSPRQGKRVKISGSWTNPWFSDSNGQPVVFDDDTEETDQESDDDQSRGFLPSIDSFPQWLSSRKAAWKKSMSSTGPLVYLGMHILRNPETSPSWGIVISLFGNTLLGVSSTRIDRVPAWAYATDSMPPSALQASTTNELQQAFRGMPVSTHQPDTKLGLAPGDMILSINGFVLSSFGGMPAIASYLKHTSTLHLVVLRDAEQQQASTEKVHRLLTKRIGQDPLLSGLRDALQRLGHRRPYIANGYQQQNPCFWYQLPGTTAAKHPIKSHALPPICRNHLFRDKEGNPIPFDEEGDNDFYENLYGCSTDCKFLVPDVTRESFPTWITQRKEKWRRNWKGRDLKHEIDSADESDSDGDFWGSCSVSRDFWTDQGFPSFQHWHAASTQKWKRSYSWNREKMRKIESACEKIVHFPSAGSRNAEQNLQEWLEVRKSQWRIQRRKRMLERKDDVTKVEGSSDKSRSRHEQDGKVMGRKNAATDEMLVIDAVLEVQERRKQEEIAKEPFDISFIFDSRIGAPDDVIAHCLKFLPQSDHGQLLCVSSSTSASLKERSSVWHQLCPSHWSLPRRPRKPWCELYVTRIRQEETIKRKRSDDLLGKISSILWRGDHLHKIEKLVNDAEERFRFDVNYCSGVVCERNSILNLAVINGRPKTAKWLVEEKKADLETCDRGNFTPLINAAWAGNRYLVRFFLGHGSDRTKIGTGHYTEPLAPPDFSGLTAEGWARKKGHHELAKLIHLGL